MPRAASVGEKGSLRDIRMGRAALSASSEDADKARARFVVRVFGKRLSFCAMAAGISSGCW